MLGLNNNSFNRGEEIVYTFRPRFLAHSKTIFLKLIGMIILIYSFGFLVNSMYTIQSAVINFVHLPLVQYSIYLIILIIAIVSLWIIFDLGKWYSKKYILTTQRIISEEGLLRKKKSSIIYEKIEDITTFQNLSSRLVSAGTIHIYGGHDNMHVILEDIPNPYEIEEKINELMSNSWNKNRNHYSKRNNRSKRHKSYNNRDYDEMNDFDYIDRTGSSKQYPVNTFDDTYDERYGYSGKSEYYGEKFDYDEGYDYQDNNIKYKNHPYGKQRKNHKVNYNENDYVNNNLDSNQDNYFNSKKLSFDNPQFWEDDYSEEQTPKNYSKKSKQSRETFKKNRKKAMDRHSERFKRN